MYFSKIKRGKRFPGDLECTYDRKKIRCMYAWSPKGSMAIKILRNVIKTLDMMDIFDYFVVISLARSLTAISIDYNFRVFSISTMMCIHGLP